MKKGVKIGVGISLIIVFAIIVTLLIFNTKEEEIIKEYNLYTIMYSASYNDYKVFENEENFRIIKDTESLNLILDKVKNTEYKNTFDNKFFENNNLLVIEAEINPELNKCEINNDKVNVLVYVASPLVSSSGYNVYLANFSLYLIPINKNIPDNNINVEVTTYPDKEY